MIDLTRTPVQPDWTQTSRGYDAALGREAAGYSSDRGGGEQAADSPRRRGSFFGHLLGEDQPASIEGWQRFVVRARDERGDPVSDYVVEVLRQNERGEWESFQEMSTDVHAYQVDNSFRCFHVKLPQCLSSGETSYGSGSTPVPERNCSLTRVTAARPGNSLQLPSPWS
jgi:hypothetical protein